MNAVLVTLPSFSDLAKKEIKELIGKQSIKLANGFIEFKGEYNDFFNLIYNTQIAYDILIDTNISTPDNIKFRIPKGTYSVRASNRELEKQAAEKFHPILKSKVNLSKPDYEIGVYQIDNKWLYGFRPFKNIEKREYKVFTSNYSIKAPIAFAMTYGNAKNIVCLYSRDGIIPIEAALHYSKSPRFYQKNEIINISQRYTNNITLKEPNKERKNIYATSTEFADIKRSKSNAKISGIIKEIEFSRNDLDNIDIKYEKIDLIATMPPIISKRFPEEDAIMLYEDLLSQSKKILTKSGQLVIYVNSRTLNIIDPNLIKQSLPIGNENFILFIKP